MKDFFLNFVRERLLSFLPRKVPCCFNALAEEVKGLARKGLLAANFELPYLYLCLFDFSGIRIIIVCGSMATNHLVSLYSSRFSKRGQDKKSLVALCLVAGCLVLPGRLWDISKKRNIRPRQATESEISEFSRREKCFNFLQ